MDVRGEHCMGVGNGGMVLWGTGGMVLWEMKNHEG